MDYPLISIALHETAQALQDTARQLDQLTPDLLGPVQTLHYALDLAAAELEELVTEALQQPTAHGPGSAALPGVETVRGP